MRDAPQPQPHPQLFSPGLAVSDNGAEASIVKGSNVEGGIAAPLRGIDKGGWLLCLRGLAAQALTPIGVRRGRHCLESLEHLRQLPFEQVEFGNLLLDGAQLLRHEGVQAGTHRQTLPALKLCRQRFERGEGEPRARARRMNRSRWTSWRE